MLDYITLAIACTYINKKKRLVTAITSLILFATKESVSVKRPFITYLLYYTRQSMYIDIKKKIKLAQLRASKVEIKT